MGAVVADLDDAALRFGYRLIEWRGIYDVDMFGRREMMKMECLVQERKEGKQRRRRRSVWYMLSWLVL